MKKTRRSFLWHCTAPALAAMALHALPALAQPAPPAGPVILVVGDSLSAEYGLRRGQGWVALLEQQLARDTPAARVVNASISGDTTSGGRSRLPGLLRRHRPSVVVLELGANDALRGLPLSMTRDNLGAMARDAKAAGAKVLLLGMRMPPNYGRRYGEEFGALFGQVADSESASLVPFMLKGVADAPNPEAMFQADRLHPREQAQAVILANVWPALKRLLR